MRNVLRIFRSSALGNLLPCAVRSVWYLWLKSGKNEEEPDRGWKKFWDPDWFLMWYCLLRSLSGNPVLFFRYAGSAGTGNSRFLLPGGPDPACIFQCDVDGPSAENRWEPQILPGTSDHLDRSDSSACICQLLFVCAAFYSGAPYFDSCNRTNFYSEFPFPQTEQ